MCGIAGYFGKKHIPTEVVHRTLHLMKRRGPNGQHYQEFKLDNNRHCLLLHSRLSILDLDQRSDQPFHYNDKTIIYNGEIYNYIEVREELIKLGHRFITESDTEVLIHALDEWDLEALNKLEGMWAFALFDNREKSLTLSRDPFGEKPLYIYEPEPGEIYFGSEIKCIASMASTKFNVNLNQVEKFLTTGYKSLFKSQESFFEGVNHFEPATVLRIAPKRKYKTQYWKLKDRDSFDGSITEAVTEIREKLIKIVSQRLRSDVPLAFCLSGGVDSNSIISIAKNIFNYNVHAFSILNRDEKYDEKDDILQSIQEYKIDNTIIYIEKDNFFGNLNEIVKYHDAPVSTLTYYMNWQLYKEIADKGFRVAIMGTGGDEIFSGYYDHHNFYLSDIKDDPKSHETALFNWEKWIKPIVRNPYLSDPKLFTKKPFFRDHIYLNANEFAKYLNNPASTLFEEKFYNTHSLLKNRMLNELFHETVPISLNQDDLNCMYHSIENRSPFLSRTLVEFCQHLPVKFYIQEGFNKYLLRKAMKGIVPNHIVTRKKKMGLNTPINYLIDLNDKTISNKILEDSPVFEIVNRDKIKSLISQANFPNSESKFLFSFLSVKAFLEEYA